jgi:hypothetical protein
MRLGLICVLLGGLIGANLVLFTASARQLLDAQTERAITERLDADLRLWSAQHHGC